MTCGRSIEGSKRGQLASHRFILELPSNPSLLEDMTRDLYGSKGGGSLEHADQPRERSFAGHIDGS